MKLKGEIEMSKIKDDIQEVLSVLNDGDTILVGGFGLVGAPLTLIEGLIE